MEKDQSLLLSVSDFISLTNQTLEYAYPSVSIEGEVASFKVNQNKYIFFDLKDAGGSVGCFMTVWQLRQPVEDGMKVIVSATPKLTQWGKFSLTVKAIRPSGAGDIKKSFDILKTKLESEGLFAAERKRSLPTAPQHIAVISSTQAAGYADFMKILGDRWGGMRVDVAHVQVQGADAPDQIIRALNYFNTRIELPEVIVIVRGGGSADDLSAFNDEPLVREIASSRVPTLVGVGHEVDTSLADLAADVRAATPSNAAQLVVPDKMEIIRQNRGFVRSISGRVLQAVDHYQQTAARTLDYCAEAIRLRFERSLDEVAQRRRILAELDPRHVLARGYAIIRGDVAIGGLIEIEKSTLLISAEVKDVRKKES